MKSNSQPSEPSELMNDFLSGLFFSLCSPSAAHFFPSLRFVLLTSFTDRVEEEKKKKKSLSPACTPERAGAKKKARTASAAREKSSMTRNARLGRNIYINSKQVVFGEKAIGLAHNAS